MSGFYRDKIVTVIGGSSGIGRELVKMLADQGAIVIIGGRNPEPGDSLIRELTGRGEVSFEPVDVRKAEDCERFFAAVMNSHGRLDFAFNAAGIIMGGEIRDHKIEDVHNVLETNVLGTSYCAFYAYRIMTQQGFGHIINFSSGAGIFPLPLMGVYSSSKFAVYGLSEAMRIEGRRLGVRVSSVTPGLVDTPIYETGIYSKANKSKSKGLLQKRAYMIQPDQAARKILRGVEHNRAVIGTQFYVRTTWLSYRLFPWAYRAVVGLLLPIFRRHYRRATKNDE